MVKPVPVKKKPIFKVEKGRVLVSHGAHLCSANCQYCYFRLETELRKSKGITTGEVLATLPSVETIPRSLAEFAKKKYFHTIQVGYDFDLFDAPESALKLLEGLSASLDKHITLSTKSVGRLRESHLARLQGVKQALEKKGRHLGIIMTLTSWDSAKQIEEGVAHPRERLDFVKKLKSLQIPTFVAIRPVLPHLKDEEFIKLLDEIKESGADAILPGPLYFDKERKLLEFMPPGSLDDRFITKKPVSWSPSKVDWYRYEDPGQMRMIAEQAQQRGIQVLWSSAHVPDFIASKLAKRESKRLKR